jgi:phospholipase/carboxylesterase
MADSMILPAVEMSSTMPVTASVIWMHGLGADGYDFSDIIPELQLPRTLGVRFIFPHAPHRPVTLNGGYVMRAWYDLLSPDLPSNEDDAGIRASETAIHALIQREISKGIPASRIVLAGFSQGGAIALHTGLRYPQRLAGILGLSTYLPLAASLRAECHAANADVPILMLHGDADAVITIEEAESACAVLRDCGYAVEWRRYPMAHALCPREIYDIGAWLRRVLSD